MSVFRCQCACCVRRDKELNSYYFLSDSSVANLKFKQENKQLREENEKLRNALAYYAQGENPEFETDDWERFCDEKCANALKISGHHSIDCEQRHGKIARKTLREIGGSGDNFCKI